LRTPIYLKLTALLLLLCSPVFAGVNNITEEDGSPTLYPWQIKFANGTVTDNGGGSVSVAGGSGETNTASNSGDGVGVFKVKAGVDLQFKSLVSGDNITISQDANSVRISASTSGSPGAPTNSVQFNDASSFGGDTSLIWDKVLNRLSISRDASQGGEAIRISSDTGAVLANISHDGGAMFQTLQLKAAPLSLAEGGVGIRSGTSGAVPYFSGTGTVASSSLLTANAVMLGGGSATAPLTITADTSTAHFLGSTATAPAFRQIRTGDVVGTQPVATGGTGIVAGTSGGVPYFINGGLMASSLAFAANAVVIGGGAGVAPSTITADTTAGHVLVSTTGSPAFRQLLTGDTIGTLPVARGGTGITTGNSGGIPFFANTGLMGTSAALTANAVVVGGGAGTTPATITADTVVTHALFARSGTPAFRQILTTDVVGVYPAAAATPGGSTTQFQYNNASAFAGTPLITTDGIRFAQGPGTSTLISHDVAGSFRTVPFALTDGTTINVDASRSNFFTVTLAGAPRTLAAPTNGINGQKIVIRISQDATGSRKIGTAAGIKYGTDVPSYDATTTAGNKDYLFLVCNSNSNSWDVAGISKGYN